MVKNNEHEKRREQSVQSEKSGALTADHQSKIKQTPQQIHPEDIPTAETKLDPFEIEFLPEFKGGRGPRNPFVNEFGVEIGDHMYQSEHSPLNQWDKDTDPFVMAGDQWVHPYKDIGFQTEENRDYFERGIHPQGAVGGRFMHPDKDVAYESNRQDVGKEEDEAEEGEGESPM